jgi:hypothetical protein
MEGSNGTQRLSRNNSSALDDVHHLSGSQLFNGPEEIAMKPVNVMVPAEIREALEKRLAHFNELHGLKLNLSAYVRMIFEKHVKETK